MFVLVQYDRRVLPFLFIEGFNQATCLQFKSPVRMMLSC